MDSAAIEEELATPSALIPFALFEVVYMINGGFMRRGQLLDGCGVLKDHDIKVRITHGRADYVCQPGAAYQLASTLETLGVDVTLEFVAGAGHSDSEPGLVDAMVRVTDSLGHEMLRAGGDGRTKG